MDSLSLKLGHQVTSANIYETSLEDHCGSVASAAGLRVTGSTSAYAAGKAALIGLTVDLARGLAPVRVNAVGANGSQP